MCVNGIYLFLFASRKSDKIMYILKVSSTRSNDRDVERVQWFVVGNLIFLWLRTIKSNWQEIDNRVFTQLAAALRNHDKQNKKRWPSENNQNQRNLFTLYYLCLIKKLWCSVIFDDRIRRKLTNLKVCEIFYWCFFGFRNSLSHNEARIKRSDRIFRESRFFYEKKKPTNKYAHVIITKQFNF